ncbi:MAG: glycosyltransferase family 1 protein [Gammaproteobacteria bacterium]|nr:glycosyltransferase family 1 protein [Gammaproteobacteria bacterium]
MRIAIITDAWHPQINGIVTTLVNTVQELIKLDHTVQVFDSAPFKTIACPGYPHFKLAFLCGPRLRPLIEQFNPDAIHIATEGPVGFAARRYCHHKGYRYTTSLHSHYPEYLKLRVGFPPIISHAYMRWFHRKSSGIMVATESLKSQFQKKGYRNFRSWTLGVNTDLFRPGDKSFLNDQRPIFIYAGRLAVEKNVEDFLQLDLPGTKYVIGDGPLYDTLKQKYSNARFVGYKTGLELTHYLAAADVFVFPSKTDTFGLVLLEALACGVPVATYPVPGPNDVIRDSKVGQLNTNLQTAALTCLTLNPHDCRQYALNYSWQQSAKAFINNLIEK